MYLQQDMQPVQLLRPCWVVKVVHVSVCVMPECNDDQSKEARQCVGAAGEGI